MIFIEKNEINDFQNRCLVAIFLDCYQEFDLVEYVGKNCFIVYDRIKEKERKIYLFESPANAEKDDYVFQVQLSKLKQTECIYEKLTPVFKKELVDFSKNPFHYICEKFWENQWQKKYTKLLDVQDKKALFSNNIPNPPTEEYKILYKYKADPDDNCNDFTVKDATSVKFETSNVSCKTLDIRKDQFQDFIKGTLAFCKPSSFNDPFDCDCEIDDISVITMFLYELFSGKVSIKIIKEVLTAIYSGVDNSNYELLYNELLARVSKTGQINNKQPEEIKHAIEEGIISTKNIKDTFRVLCLSPFNSDILMWGYYGNCGSGLCSEYSFYQLIEDLSKKEEDAICIYGKVDYKNTKPTIDYNTNEKYNGILKYVVDCMFTKSKKWEHEKEFRIVVIKNNAPNVYLLQSEASSYYLGCKNIEHPLQDRYDFPEEKTLHQLKKDRTEYKLIE